MPRHFGGLTVEYWMVPGQGELTLEYLLIFEQRPTNVHGSWVHVESDIHYPWFNPKQGWEPPWLYHVRMTTTSCDGTARVTVRWTNPEGDEAVEVIEHPLGNAVQPSHQAPGSPTPVALPAPPFRLVEGIRDARRLGRYKQPSNGPDVEKVREILTHIYSVLRAGLGHVWLEMDWGRRTTWEGTPLLQVDDLTALPPGLLEEAWAQLVSEMLILSPYAGPNIVYTDGALGEREIFEHMLSGDPCYSIVAACQQLCSIALIARGFEGFARVLPVQAVTPDCRKSAGGTFLRPKDHPKSLWVRNAIDKHKVGPGSVWGYFIKDPDLPKDKHFPHVAFTLRVHEGTKEVQLLDTGAMSAPWEQSPPIPGAGGNYDYPPWKWGIPGSSAKQKWYTGLWLCPPSPDLAGAVARARRARPLGLARLLLVRRGPKQPWMSDLREKKLVFASALLPMWDGDGEPFSLARLARSLVGQPYFADYMAAWAVCAPKRGGGFYEAMVTSGDLSGCTADLKGKPFPKRLDRKYVQLMEVLGVDRDGGPKVLGVGGRISGPTRLMNLKIPWRASTADINALPPKPAKGAGPYPERLDVPLPANLAPTWFSRWPGR